MLIISNLIYYGTNMTDIYTDYNDIKGDSYFSFPSVCTSPF